MLKNRVLQSSGVTVGASATNTPVSGNLNLPNSRDLQVKVVFSALSESTGITGKLQDSYDGGSTFYDVGSESQFTITKKTLTCGTAEVTTVTIPATADATQADYWHFVAQDGKKFAVWLDIDAAGTAPTGVLYVASDYQIKVSIVTGGSAADNAALFRAALVANAQWTARVTTGAVATASITVTQIYGGAVTDAAPKSENDGGAGSISSSTDTPGADGNVNISTNVASISSHGFVTGDRVIVVGAGLPGGLTTQTTYYVIKVDANSLKFATSQSDAFAGTAVDVTTYGTAAAKVYKADYEIRMTELDATDLAQLPVWDTCVFAISSGSSDSCTVSAVYVNDELAA